MKPIETLHKELIQRMPDLNTDLDRPAQDDGRWFLTLGLDDYELIVEWSPVLGFGVTASTFIEPPSLKGYGEGPDEVYKSIADVLPRVMHLLQSKVLTRPPR